MDPRLADGSSQQFFKAAKDAPAVLYAQAQSFRFCSIQIGFSPGFLQAPSMDSPGLLRTTPALRREEMQRPRGEEDPEMPLEAGRGGADRSDCRGILFGPYLQILRERLAFRGAYGCDRFFHRRVRFLLVSTPLVRENRNTSKYLGRNQLLY